MPGKLHEVQLKRVLAKNPWLSTKLFRRGLIETLGKEFDFDDEDEAEVRDYCRFIPDAYKICKFCQIVLIYEVEVSNTVGEKRIRQCADLDFAIDCVAPGWHVVLVVVDRFGRETVLEDMFEYWYDFCKQDRLGT